MLSGWSSNSNYTLLGRLRSIAQTISYEVCIILIIIIFLLLIFNLNLIKFFKYQFYLRFIFLNFIISIIVLIIFLAETNRSPFDFSEGESELVSGFNIEYRRGGFALIFLAEYSRILFISILFGLMFLGNRLIYFTLFLKVSLIVLLFI